MVAKSISPINKIKLNTPKGKKWAKKHEGSVVN